ncbi:MAG: type II secretion system F family protein [Ardenticatenaceae bacterium]|nr:type II secretion system F family protein [Ardenticatenaceae bacterium]
MGLLIGLMAMVAVLILAEGMRRLSVPRSGKLLAELVYGESAPEAKQTYFQRRVLPVARPLAERFEFLEPFSEPEKVAFKLDYAGRPYDMDAQQFLGVQVYMMLVGLVGGLVYFFVAITLGLCGGAIALLAGPTAGFFLPRLWLDNKVKKRQEQINLSMPDFLDMMVVSVRAGMSFDNALRLVCVHITGPLTEELRRVIRELEVGEPRNIAFRRLVKRNTSEDLRAFIDALLQADELGTPIAKTLEVQAEELRTIRINRARERAAKASPNISLVTVFLVVPSVLCLFLSMMVMSIISGGQLTTIGP